MWRGGVVELCLLCWFRIVRNFGQALSRILAFAVVGVAASVHRQPFVPLHLCIDSHLCRCIVQRLCVAVFMHPCITALCGCLYASLHNDFVRPPSCILAHRACSVGFASCLVSRLGCHIVWQLSAAAFKHPCLKLWASTITHPCVCGRWGRRVLAPTLGDRYRASLHVYERSVGFASVQSLWAFIL